MKKITKTSYKKFLKPILQKDFDKSKIEKIINVKQMTNEDKLFNEFNCLVADSSIPHGVKYNRIKILFFKSIDEALNGITINDRNLKIDPNFYRMGELFEKYQKFLEKEIN